MSLKICGGTSLSGSWDMPATRSDCFTLTKKGFSKLLMFSIYSSLINQEFLLLKGSTWTHTTSMLEPRQFASSIVINENVSTTSNKFIEYQYKILCILNFWLYHIRFYLLLEEPTFKLVQKIVMFTTQPNLSWMEKHQKARTFLCLFRTHVS